MNLQTVTCFGCRRTLEPGQARLGRAWIADTLYRTEYVCGDCWLRATQLGRLLVVWGDVGYSIEAVTGSEVGEEVRRKA